MIKLPEEGDIISMFSVGPLRFEASLKGNIFVTDMLNRRKYQLIYHETNELPLIMVLVEKD